MDSKIKNIMKINQREEQNELKQIIYIEKTKSTISDIFDCSSMLGFLNSFS